MFLMDYRLACLSIFSLPLFHFPAQRIGSTLRGVRKRNIELKAELNNAVAESLSMDGVLLSRLFGREDVSSRRFDDSCNRVSGRSACELCD